MYKLYSLLHIIRQFIKRKIQKKVLTFPFQGLKHKNILRYIMFEMHFYKIGNIDNNERQKMIY
jgi:hypothetical protein